ncbi:MAG: pilus assembly protein PilM [candidate division KSB1 bacterium]|nr:pilus assembly protein PilM [candidate division KSB1 bacterium]
MANPGPQQPDTRKAAIPQVNKGARGESYPGGENFADIEWLLRASPGPPEEPIFEDADEAREEPAPLLSPVHIDPESLHASEKQLRELLEFLGLEEAIPSETEVSSLVEPAESGAGDLSEAQLESPPLPDFDLMEGTPAPTEGQDPLADVLIPQESSDDSESFIRDVLEDLLPPDAEQVLSSFEGLGEPESEKAPTPSRESPSAEEARGAPDSVAPLPSSGRRAVDDFLAALELAPDPGLPEGTGPDAPPQPILPRAEDSEGQEPRGSVTAAASGPAERPPEAELPPEIGLEEIAQRFETAWADAEASEATEDSVEIVLHQDVPRPGILHRLGFREVDRRLGIDIGSSEITFVCLAKRGRRYDLEAYGILPFRRLGETGDASGAILRTLQSILAERQIRQAPVEASVQIAETAVRILELPKLPRKETLRAISWTLRKDLPFPAEEAEMVFRPMAEGSSKRQTLLVVAAERENLLKHARLLQAAGAHLSGIYSASVALFELFRRTKLLRSDACQVLVNIGTLHTQILFIQNGRLAFERTITTALDDFLGALTETLFYEGQSRSLGQREAFWILRRYGVAGFGAGETTTDGVPLNDIAISVRPVLEKFTSELSRSLDYFRSKFGVTSFERIWVCGIGATVLNLSRILESETGLPTSCFHPFLPETGLPIHSSLEGLDEYAPSLVVPLGLALGPAQELNLLPRHLRRSRSIQYAHKALAYGALFGLLGMGLLSGIVRYDKTIEQNELAAVRDQYEALVRHQEELQRLQQIWTRIGRDLKGLQEALPSEPLLPLYLHALSKLTPAKIALTSVEIVEREEAVQQMRQVVSDDALAFVRLKGVVLPDPPREGTHLAHFLVALRTCGLFANVRVEENRPSENSRIGAEFSIIAEIPKGIAP